MISDISKSSHRRSGKLLAYSYDSCNFSLRCTSTSRSRNAGLDLTTLTRNTNMACRTEIPYRPDIIALRASNQVGTVDNSPTEAPTPYAADSEHSQRQLPPWSGSNDSTPDARLHSQLQCEHEGDGCGQVQEAVACCEQQLCCQATVPCPGMQPTMSSVE